MAVLGQPQTHSVHTPQKLASPSHAHPTRGLPTRAMAHCTLISRPIQKHDDRLGGQACCKQHASPTRLWEEEAHPPTLEPPLFAVLPDPARDDVGCHGASSGEPPAQKPSSCALSFVCQKGLCVRTVPALSPLWGRVWRVLGRTCLDGCFRVFWPVTADPSRAVLAPSLNATLGVANEFSNKCQVEG